MTAHGTTWNADGRPKLRSDLAVERDGKQFVLHDPHRVGRPVGLSAAGFELAARYFDGDRTLGQIHGELDAEVSLTTLADLARGLDEALLLDSPRFHDRLTTPVRPPSCIGCYDADPDELRAQLAVLFTSPGGPGMPAAGRPVPSDGGRLRAVLLPHMDYARGNVCYGWGFKELVERADATVFVIVATSHYSAHRFTLTRQHFETPLGVVETDRSYVDAIADAYGDGLFDDPFAHAPEHSIELEVVLLQYLYEGRRPIRIVPLLVGSFGDCVEAGTPPREAADVRRMIEALRNAEAASAEKVCYLISGDLAHVGPKFGDRQPVAAPFLKASRAKDEALLARAAAADPDGYFAAIAAEGDARRICGLPPTYLTLQTIRPRSGRVLNYQQYVHPRGHESVSFASMAFEG